MNVRGGNLPGIQSEAGLICEVFQLVDTVARKLRQFQRRTISEADLTPPQYSILSLLWQKDGRQFGELASARCCSSSTITGIVDTMEKKGLVIRELNPKDRRTLLLRLTEQGAALEHSTPSLDEIFENCCVGIEPDELQQVGELLGKLKDGLTFY